MKARGPTIIVHNAVTHSHILKYRSQYIQNIRRYKIGGRAATAQSTATLSARGRPLNTEWGYMMRL